MSKDKLNDPVAEMVAGKLEESRQAPAQSMVAIQRGLHVRRTTGGIPVVRVHYTALPDRDPEINPQWKIQARKEYTSQASWDREMEIRDEAGGGELVFADTLITHWKKIVIEDPRWRPSPHWRVEGGFDHGKTNATALERAYIDHEGTVYMCGEYYMPGMEVWQHAPQIERMVDYAQISTCYADPTIFDMNMQQSGGAGNAHERAKSINDLYVEQGINIFRPFVGDRVDVSFAARVMLHWANLGEREPSLKIVCRNYSETPQPGLHDWDSPNLLWELMRRRRVKLTAHQLMNRNPSEALVDKDNHATDSCKYLCMSLPSPTDRPLDQQLAERMKGLDPTSAMIARQRFAKELETDNAPVFVGGVAERRRRMLNRR